MHSVENAFIEDSRDYAVSYRNKQQRELDMTYPHRPEHCDFLRLLIQEAQEHIDHCDELLMHKVGQS